ncbi:MAG: response regulator [Desulfobacteraceae bacterium]|jgi:DNA-binding NtrC family response regulator|nr:response regulator [Desulfobacteraceae bacterium]
MSDGLDVIVLDDDPGICEIVSELIESFYTWGKVYSFSDPEKAISFCLERDIGVAIFVVDVFLGGLSGFYFLDAIDERYPTAHEDTIMISGNASDDVVNMCLASNVYYLLEKPVKPYALQLAVRAITAKYLDFAKKLMQDTDFAEHVSRL